MANLVKKSMLEKRCPHCGANISYLNYSANFGERAYGYSNGTYSIEYDEHDLSESNIEDSDSFEEYDYEYECPECGRGVEVSGLEDLDIEIEDSLEKAKRLEIIKNERKNKILKQFVK